MSRWIKVGVVALIVMSLAVGLMGTVLAEPSNPGGNAVAGRGGWGMSFRGLPDSVGSLLGLTQDEICAQRNEGKSLVEIASNAPNPTDEASLVQALAAERQAAVDQRVVAGELSEEKAELMKQRMQERVATMVGRTEMGPNRAVGANGEQIRQGGRWQAENPGIRGAGPGYGMGNCPYATEAPAE